LLVISLVVLSTGMGLTMAPSTASIMSSLPLAKAGVGSAMNDTNRELGGALGVAVLGSIVTSRYVHSLRDAVAPLPAPLRSLAESSLGAAREVARQVGGPVGDRLSLAARSGFSDAMSSALRIGGVVAVVAAVIVWYVLPAGIAASEEQAMHGGHEVDLTEARPTDDVAVLD
jgi:hypothetical protein